MSDARWKRQERETAALLGGKRLPNSGRGQADIETEDLSVEHKCRVLPDWLLDALDQAARNAGGKAPIVIMIDAVQGRKARRVVVLDLDVFIAMQEEAGVTPPVRDRMQDTRMPRKAALHG